MKVFFIASVFPRKPHDTRSPNVVVNEAISAFLELGHQVVFQLLLDEPERQLTGEESMRLVEVADRPGAEVSPIIWSDRIPRYLRRVHRPLWRYYPASVLGPLLEERVRSSDADVVFSLWSHSALPAAAFLTSAPKAIYYGNLDHKQNEARLHDPALFDFPFRGAFKRAVMRRHVKKVAKYHFALMKQYDIVWNVCKVDVDIQRANGVETAAYIENMWPVPQETDFRSIRRRLEQISPLKVCASIGGLQGTANTYGLAFLGSEIAPAAERAFGADGVELHVFGARRPTQAVQRLLQKPSIRIRGFVEDIDREMLESPIFLLCNNCGFYKAGHTRILHAWSLESCLVAHAGNKDTMPELEHNRNVLLANTAEEFAYWLGECKSSRDLRERVGRAGRETFLDCFTPFRVMKKVCKELEALVAPAQAYA